MKLHQLHLTQFRNYSSAQLNFNKDINGIFGQNGSGKTNILDAIHFLAFTRGFRSTKDKLAIKEGDDFFIIEGQFIIDERPLEIQCNLVQSKGKKILVNKAPLEKSSEHLGKIPLVTILPNDTDLINGGGSSRRKFLDMLISQYNKDYLHHLIQYDKILSQRNALLKLFAERNQFDRDQLELWDSQLIPHGIRIIEGRRQFLDNFFPLFQKFFKLIVSTKEMPEIHYQSQIERNDIDGWIQLYKAREQRDRYSQHTTAGIHRDDLIFRINGQEVKSFGSQGQQKTFVIALKLAQYQLLHKETQIPPMLLLDDIFDKLDEQRLRSIAQILDREVEGQVFVTDTSYEKLNTIFEYILHRTTAYFEVTSGNVQAYHHEQ